MAFDASYFEQGLFTQLHGLPGHPVVRVILHNGREYLVKQIHGVATGYVMLEIYPPEGESRGTFKFPPAAALLDASSSPIAVAFEAIAQVHVQSTAPEQRGRIGFQHG